MSTVFFPKHNSVIATEIYLRLGTTVKNIQGFEMHSREECASVAVSRVENSQIFLDYFYLNH